jgi:hypothetical protein
MRILIYCSRSRTWEPPLVGRPLFSTFTRTPTKSTPLAVPHLQADPEKDSETRESPLVGRPPPPLENHPQPDGHSKSFLGSHLGLTITSKPQGCFAYWRALSPPNYLIASPALWPSSRNYPSRRVDPFLPLRKKEKVAQSHSTTALGLTTSRIIKSTWPTFTMRRKTSWNPSTTMNNSRTSQPKSPQLALPKTKMRSTEGFGGQRTPSTRNAGATRRIAPVYQGILTMLLQQLQIASTVC